MTTNPTVLHSTPKIQKMSFLLLYAYQYIGIKPLAELWFPPGMSIDNIEFIQSHGSTQEVDKILVKNYSTGDRYYVVEVEPLKFFVRSVQITPSDRIYGAYVETPSMAIQLAIDWAGMDKSAILDIYKNPILPLAPSIFPG